MTQQISQHQETFAWDIKLPTSLKLPTKRLALEKDCKVQQIVAEAVTEYIQKQAPKVGEKIDF